MEIDFNPDKDAINGSKHGLSLAEAAQLDLAEAFVVLDERRAYGEIRNRPMG